VPTSEDNLVGVSRTNYLKDYIIGVGVGDELVLEDKADSDGLPSVLHPLEHLCVLDSDGSAGNFGIFGIVFHVSCMNRINADRCY